MPMKIACKAAHTCAAFLFYELGCCNAMKLLLCHSLVRSYQYAAFITAD